MDLAFRVSDTRKNGDGFTFHPRRQFTAIDERLYFRKITAVIVAMFVFVIVRIFVAVVTVMRMFMRMLMIVAMVMVVVFVMMVSIRQMNIELHTSDALPFLTPHVQMIAIELQLPQLAFQFMRIHAQVDECRNEHIAGDAAKDIQVKRFHFSVKALIWLAA